MPMSLHIANCYLPNAGKWYNSIEPGGYCLPTRYVVHLDCAREPMMNRRIGFAFLLLAFTVLALVWTGVHMSFAYVRGQTVAAGEIRRDPISVPRGQADRLTVQIDMLGGSLNLAGRAAHLLDGYVESNSDWLHPLVDYTETGGLGILTVQHRDLAELGTFVNAENHTATWDIQLNSSLPIASLDVAVGADESVIDLRDLQIRTARVDMMGGDLTVNLAQTWPDNVDVRLTGISGELTVHLPADMGVIVYADQAFGEVTATGLRPLPGEGERYVNAAYGATDATLSLSADMALGRIRLIVEE